MGRLEFICAFVSRARNEASPSTRGPSNPFRAHRFKDGVAPPPEEREGGRAAASEEEKLDQRSSGSEKENIDLRSCKYCKINVPVAVRTERIIETDQYISHFLVPKPGIRQRLQELSDYNDNCAE